MKAAPEGVAMAKNRKNGELPIEGRKINLVFTKVAKKIDLERSQPTHVAMFATDNDGNEIDLSGPMYLTIKARSTEEFRELVELYYPPKTWAWRRISEICREAMHDADICRVPEAVAFLKMVESITERAYGDDSDKEILRPLTDILKSDEARKNAQSKNSAARAWVLEEWGSRADKGQGKAAFSRQHSPLVKQKFSLLVTPDTIARDWLPKGKA
jgi:hypothetical protein